VFRTSNITKDWSEAGSFAASSSSAVPVTMPGVVRALLSPSFSFFGTTLTRIWSSSMKVMVDGRDRWALRAARMCRRSSECMLHPRRNREACLHLSTQK
jgi:hypothetical protein